MKLSDLTLIQILGIILVINGALSGAVNELTDLLGPAMAKHVLSITVIGSGICGGFITMFGGLGSQVKNVLAMPGVEKIAVNGQASATLATIAVDPLQDKIAPTPAAMDRVTATAAKAAVILAILLAGMSVDPNPASAQVKRLTGNIGNDLGITRAVPTSSDPLANIIGALDAKLLPDLQYAKVMADASGSKVTAPCFGAWIDLINVRQKAVTGTDGQPLPFPDPGVISRFEQLVELRNALQPDSSFMIACSPVASMVKKDIVGFIGIVISGGAGLATLVPGL